MVGDFKAVSELPHVAAQVVATAPIARSKLGNLNCANQWSHYKWKRRSLSRGIPSNGGKGQNAFWGKKRESATLKISYWVLIENIDIHEIIGVDLSDIGFEAIEVGLNGRQWFYQKPWLIPSLNGRIDNVDVEINAADRIKFAAGIFSPDNSGSLFS